VANQVAAVNASQLLERVLYMGIISTAEKPTIDELQTGCMR
jgi:hypothetical protein